MGVGRGEGGEGRDGGGELPEGGVGVDGDGGGQRVGVVVRRGGAQERRVGHGSSLHPEVIHAGGEMIKYW